jgi:hypothetical protein
MALSKSKKRFGVSVRLSPYRQMALSVQAGEKTSRSVRKGMAPSIPEVSAQEPVKKSFKSLEDSAPLPFQREDSPLAW